MKFNHLLHSIQQTHDALQAQAIAAVNRSLTVRNWLIGFYIVEFEQKGEDRANSTGNNSGDTVPIFNRPIFGTVPQELRESEEDKLLIVQTVSEYLVQIH